MDNYTYFPLIRKLHSASEAEKKILQLGASLLGLGQRSIVVSGLRNKEIVKT
jgi:hypothetical protein